MPQIPKDHSLDSTRALFSEGYSFISKRCRRYGSDLFETRIMLTKVVCMTGAAAAAQFYHPDRFTRRRAMPVPAVTLLQDFGSVMLMDGQDHRWRKRMFLSLMSPEALRRLADLTTTHWRARARIWGTMNRFELFREAHIPLTGAVCEWAGLSLEQEEVEQRAREFEAMIEGSGSVGPRNWRGHLMRARSEHWMRDVVQRIRAGQIRPPPGSAAQVITSHRDRAGKLLDHKVAAVELINVLRPTVANSRFIVFCAMALHASPEWRERLAGSDDDLEPFVQEVRRFYPFFPFVGGRVLQEFDWGGHRFAHGDWVLLDLYGTNQDSRIWGDPERFRPDRFRDRKISPYDFIPQGGGDHLQTHRCPGEWATIEQMKAVTRVLVRDMRYEVPEQDLRIDLDRMPALPNSRLVLSNISFARKE